MAEYFSSITIVNRDDDPHKWNLVYAHAQDCRWEPRPRWDIKRDESDTFSVHPEGGEGLHGRMGYKATCGEMLEITFECTKDGNKLSIVNGVNHVGTLKFNELGVPLGAALFLLGDSSVARTLPKGTATLQILNSALNSHLKLAPLDQTKDERGSWVTRPRLYIDPFERDYIRLRPDSLGVAKGVVYYTLADNVGYVKVMFTAHHRTGNTVRVESNLDVTADCNAWGDLHGTSTAQSTMP
ncbi:hypothetical protein PsYK624_159990 [Phanerochaete sordida]|uniref:Uncharacterized protein n=1 Tax=Phanerochaete sordida TaxID=48140 RepID=A0A9P3GRH1_9APHY|nr:hypothetical protein PsYK624_159990 [Phanerochaete sordida]